MLYLKGKREKKIKIPILQKKSNKYTQRIHDSIKRFVTQSI